MGSPIRGCGTPPEGEASQKDGPNNWRGDGENGEDKVRKGGKKISIKQTQTDAVLREINAPKAFVNGHKPKDEDQMAGIRRTEIKRVPCQDGRCGCAG